MQWGAERGELRLQLGRHRLLDRDAHEVPQVDLEPVPLLAPRAACEVLLRLLNLGRRKLPIEVRLHQLLAPVADVHHVGTALSARFFFRIRLPLCRRDMTVPTGMSRICAASAYENSPISTRTTTSRKSCGTSDSASTTESCESRSITRSSSGFCSGSAASSLL